MSYQIVHLETGQCTCLVEEPGRPPVAYAVQMLSAVGALLERTEALPPGRAIKAVIRFASGAARPFSGKVLQMEAGFPLLQWFHPRPEDAEEIHAWIRMEAGVKASAAEQRQAEQRQAGAREAGAREAETCAPATAPDTETAEVGSTGPVAETDANGSRRKFDVRARLQMKTKVVRASDLASRLRMVRVLGLDTIKELIQEAVTEAAEYLGASFRDVERKRLLEESESAFREKLRLFESEKASYEERAKLLQAELDRARALLLEERSRVLASSQFTVSNAGMVELEDRLGRVLHRSCVAGSASGGLEDELRGIVSRLLDDERAKILERAQEAQSDKIALLEKKVERLASTLTETERDRDLARREAQSLEAAGRVGFRNVVTAGLDEKDPRKERKMALLKEVFQFNKAVRDELASRGLLSGSGRGEGEQGKGERRGVIARSRGDPAGEPTAGAAAPEAVESVEPIESVEAVAVGVS